ncbi:MAG TPA: carboxypeptidase regulatory-like domain-containing protein, partial [bacterium (Candidatus Stahlbacteria)]|nr:carboxypeptidase regulatory-like domain-containing protein [Candidatus Stahlbacteria bacterium]
MDRKKVLVVGLLVLTPLLWGDFSRTTSLIDVPTAPSLKPGEFVLVFNSSFNTRSSISHPTDLDLAVRFGVGDRFEGAISAFHFTSYALSGAFTIVEEAEKRPAIVFGIDDITYNQYVSPIGVGERTFSDDSMYIVHGGRNPEIFSAYISLSKNLYFLRMVVGLGRGRFVGYGPNSRYFNTDGLFRSDWEGNPSPAAIGLFLGGAVIPYPGLEVIAEFDGRDANAGLRYHFKKGAINLGFTHLEQLVTNNPDRYSPRISAGFEASSRIFTERVRYGIIAGTIIDQASQQRLANALVEIVELGKRYRIKAGKFKLTLKPGAYNFKVSKKNYVDQSRRLIVKAG